MGKEGVKRTALSQFGRAALAAAILVLLAAVPASAQVRAGSLDRSFGVNGRVTKTLADKSAFSVPSFRLAAAHGGGLFVLAAGVLLRFKPDGRPDPGFGKHGRVAFDQVGGSQFDPTGLAVDSRGRVLVAGTTALTSQSGIPESGPNLPPELATVYRFTPAGKPDPSFGTGGVVSSTFGFQPPFVRPEPGAQVLDYPAPEVQVSGLAVDAKDRPILTGSADRNFGACRDEFPGTRPFHESFVARLTPSGEPDPTFNGSGVQAVATEFAAEEPAVDRSGGVAYIRWVGPQCESELELNGAVRGVARLDSSGSPDPSFGPDETGQFRPAKAVTFDRFGRLLLLLSGEVEGGVEPAPKPGRIVRLRPNGALDTGFGRGGTFTLPHSKGFFPAIATDPKGEVLIGGDQGGKGPLELFCLGSDGKLERRFGHGGRVVSQILGRAREGREPRVVVDDRGRVLLGAWSSLPIRKGGQIRFMLSRYTP